VRDSGQPDPVFASACQHTIEDLPADTLVYLLGGRYCENLTTVMIECCRQSIIRDIEEVPA
jgi:hypothetical protein